MLNPIILEEGGSVRLTQEYIEVAKERLGLNDPWPVRYGRWLLEISRGNFGKSITLGAPVADLISKAAWPSIQLNLVALFISTVVGIGVGLIQALRQYSILDYVSSFLTFFYISMPGFFLGLILIYLFALQLDWFPAAGYATFGVEPTLRDRLHHLVLPAATLALGGAPSLIRITRTTMLEVLGQPYVTTARSKGLQERIVILRHAFHNGLIPVVTVLGGCIPALLSGSFIIEQVFQWPGLGTLALRSVGERDYPVIMALVFVTSFLSLLAILITDIIYTLVDPRIRYD